MYWLIFRAKKRLLQRIGFQVELEVTKNFRIELRLGQELIDGLHFVGHGVETLGELEAVIGPAGERVLHPSRPIEGAYNRQSDRATDSI